MTKTKTKSNAHEVRVALDDKLTASVREPLFLTVSGSRLYGTNREGSDYDYRGWTLPPYEFLVAPASFAGLSEFNDAELPESDYKVYSLRRYLELVVKGDPQLTEMLFIPEDKIVKNSVYGEMVQGLRTAIVSNKIYMRILGYGYSEWRKAMGEKHIIADRSKDEEDVVVKIRNMKKWDKDRMDTLVGWFDEDKKIDVVPSTASLGAKRKAEFTKFGFGVSSAAHAIRLTQQLTELLTDGVMTFPRPNADMLRGIRLGEMTKDEVKKVYEESKEMAKKASETSVLRDEPDYKLVWETYRDITMKFLKNDHRFLDYPI